MKQPRQIININPLPSEVPSDGPSCIEVAIALAIGIIAGGIAPASRARAIF